MCGYEYVYPESILASPPEYTENMQSTDFGNFTFQMSLDLGQQSIMTFFGQVLTACCHIGRPQATLGHQQ